MLSAVLTGHLLVSATRKIPGGGEGLWRPLFRGLADTEAREGSVFVVFITWLATPRPSLSCVMWEHVPRCPVAVSCARQRQRIDATGLESEIVSWKYGATQ